MATDIHAPAFPLTAPPAPPELYPNVENLVTEDDKPVDGMYSEKQMRLLTEPLYTSWPGPGEGRPFLALANVGLFYKQNVPPIVPDVLLSLDVHAPQDLLLKKNRSYFQWEYGKRPDAAIEVVSNNEGEENTSKKAIYEAIGIAYYVIWDPQEILKIGRLTCYGLRETTYEPLSEPTFAKVGLGLRVWHGVFEGVETDWLRWVDSNGKLILTGEERAERLAAQLRALGVEPEV